MQAHAATLKLALDTSVVVDQQIALVKQHETARHATERAALDHQQH